MEPGIPCIAVPCICRANHRVSPTWAETLEVTVLRVHLQVCAHRREPPGVPGLGVSGLRSVVSRTRGGRLRGAAHVRKLFIGGRQPLSVQHPLRVAQPVRCPATPGSQPALVFQTSRSTHSPRTAALPYATFKQRSPTSGAIAMSLNIDVLRATLLVLTYILKVLLFSP